VCVFRHYEHYFRVPPTGPPRTPRGTRTTDWEPLVYSIGEHMAVRLSASHTGRSLLLRNIYFLIQGLVSPEGLGQLKKCNDLVGNLVDA
jgi:hypothetical protein